MSHVTFFFFFLRGGQNDQNCRFIPTVKLQCHFTARMVFSFQSAVCVTCALISQATDEAPLLQQQSVQQNQVAPDAGFQPWVHTHPTLPRPSHPSLLATLLGEPWTHYCHRHFLFSACVLTSGLARYAHYFISLFLFPLLMFSFVMEMIFMQVCLVLTWFFSGNGCVLTAHLLSNSWIETLFSSMAEFPWKPLC